MEDIMKLPKTQLREEAEGFLYSQFLKLLPMYKMQRNVSLFGYLANMGVVSVLLFNGYAFATLLLISTTLWSLLFATYFYVDMKKIHNKVKNIKKFMYIYEKKTLKTTEQHLAEQR